MSQDPLFILVILSMAIVLIVLMIGIGGFGRGGEFNRKYANKLIDSFSFWDHNIYRGFRHYRVGG